MPATNKADLLAVAVKEYDKLTKLLGQVPEKAALVKDEDDTSIKDIVGHRAHWINLFFGWYHDGLAGKLVHFPAEGYKWNNLKSYNAALRAKQADLDWETARSNLGEAHDELIEFIKQRSDAALYGRPMAGANNQWTPGRFVEAAGPSHYRSAAKYIRTRLKP